MRKVRLRRHVHVQPLQLHHGNSDRLARLVAQRRMKPELVELDQRPGYPAVPFAPLYRYATRPAPAARCAVPCPRPTARSPARHESCPAPRARESAPRASPRSRRAASARPGAAQQRSPRPAQSAPAATAPAAHLSHRCLRQNPARFAATPILARVHFRRRSFTLESSSSFFDAIAADNCCTASCRFLSSPDPSVRWLPRPLSLFLFPVPRCRRLLLTDASAD